jgi:alpha-tubulin suppressor-like RCC1 family protein
VGVILHLEFVVFHSLFNLENNVFSWGENYFGQLGHGDKNNRNTPTKVDFFDGMKITQISCGYFHCLALEGILLHLTV